MSFTILSRTMDARKALMARDPDKAPNDFLTLLLKTEGPDGLSRAEIEDNIITFIGAGHETTARALVFTVPTIPIPFQHSTRNVVPPERPPPLAA